MVYKDDEILVQERTKKDWPGLTFPGGHVEKGENFHDAVIREVKEETGLTLLKPVLCGIEEYKVTNNEDRYVMLYYKCNKFKGKIKSSNEGKAFWIKRKDLGKYKLSLDLKRIIKIMESDELSELKYTKNIPARGKRESIRIEKGDMTKIIKEPPVIAGM